MNRIKPNYFILVLIFALSFAPVSCSRSDVASGKEPVRGDLSGTWILTKPAVLDLSKYIVVDWSKSRLSLGIDGSFSAVQFPAEKQNGRIPVTIFDGRGRWRLELI